MSESRCRSCSELVLWVEMHPSGKNMPLDAVPTLEGTIERKQGKTSSKWYGRVVQRVFGDRRRLYTSHFATCPQADHFRQPR